MLPPPPSSPLFPYTTLFRSPPPAVDRRRPAARGHGRGAGRDGRDALTRRAAHAGGGHGPVVRSRNPTAFAVQRSTTSGRSEEHTSELQSHVNLVCRLLLEKK